MMSRAKSKQKTQRNTKDLPSLKKLPSKKAGSKPVAKKDQDRIVVGVKGRKDLSSLVELLRRKVPSAPKTKMPTDIQPMLATLVDEPFNDSEWQFELKLDGYRTLAYLKDGKAELRSRNNNSFNKKFEPVQQALLEWNIDAVVDGEVVVLNEEGFPDFSGIQEWERKKQGQLVYYVFDLLWFEGINIMNESLQTRREILQELMPDTGIIRYSDHIDDIGKDFFEIAKKNSIEGIIAKKKDGAYIPDSRSKTWLKIKIEQRHEAVICGYTRKKDTDRFFSSLLLGIYEKGNLKFIGQTGTGFSMAMQDDLLKRMKPLVTKQCPFDKEPSTSDKPVWLRPFLVCETKYTELTNEGVMRHSSFLGLREDKAAFELNTDEVHDTEAIVEEAGKMEDLVSPKAEKAIVNIDGHDLRLTNLNKIYWPKEKITKGDLLRYYHSMAEFMMPYMKDRPQSLNRFPNGIHGEHFYHKNMGGKVDSWLKTFKRVSESNGEPKEFLICHDSAALVYMANLGCIEMNPWHSRIQTALYPDWCVIDLDPGNRISFDKVIETAQMVRNVLESLEIPSYPKTAGSTGIHIYIPLGAKYNYEQSRQLAELIAHFVHEELPSFTSMERSPEKREDRIYLDYLQNRPIQTICAPYSVRPKPGATVSTPLHWDEVKKGLKISQFNMKNIYERVKSEGDLFEGIMQKGIDLNKIMKGLSQLI